MLLTLAGLENLVKEVVKKSGERVNFIGYADDFVITGSSKDVFVNEVKPRRFDFLKERGLALPEEKTHLTHIDDGFEFLVFNLRKYKGKLLIKPSKTNVSSFLGNLRKLIKKHATMLINDLITLLNLKLKGWANCYRHCVAKRTFGYLGHKIFWLLWRWAVRRHPTKSKDWVRRKSYMNRSGGWQFHGWQKIANMDCLYNLTQIAKTPIKRHVKIRSAATPFDPQHQDFLAKRKPKKERRHSWFDPVLTAI